MEWSSIISYSFESEWSGEILGGGGVATTDRIVLGAMED